VKHGHVVNSHRAFLGVTIADTGGGNGVYVSSVSQGSPAARAGIEVGDVITAVNGTPTRTSDELGAVLAQLMPGQTVKVAITRQSGGSSTVDLTLGQFPGG
jgi:S1-C subfamily serine protease